MRVLVTRPAGQAGEWVEGLRAAGLDAVALPLLGIGPPEDLAAVHDAWTRLPGQAMAMFVSPNAAEHFFAARPPGSAWPVAVLAASPGPGTTATLKRLGVPSAAIAEPAADAPQFDSESLWSVVGPSRSWAGAGVLIVRGESGRDWFASQLTGQGARVEYVAAYRRAAPVLDDPEKRVLAAALADPGAHLWFFSSSEAIDHLEALAPDTDWGAARAVATHPRIAERARRLGVGQVTEARPAMPAVVGCIQSLA